MKSSTNHIPKYVVKPHTDYEVAVWLYDPPGSVLIATCCGKYKQDNAEMIAKALNK